MPSLLRRAEHLLRHPEELLITLTSALGKAYAQRKALIRVFEDFLLLFRFVRAWVMGDYREVPRKTILWAVLAILYFLSPIDLIPDFLPGGYLDDIAVIAFVVKRIQKDLEKFMAWEKEQKELKAKKS